MYRIKHIFTSEFLASKLQVALAEIDLEVQ